MQHVDNNQELFLPALTGEFGQWRYYQVVMRVSDMVKNYGNNSAPSYRIKTFDEVSEIYSQKGVSRLLQRGFDPKRLNPIKKYLLLQPDKYVNNITVAIFGGDPDWLTLDLSRLNYGDSVFEEEAVNLSDTFGIVKLTGLETLFVLDGQHRLKGLRAAYEDDKSIGDESISVTLIIHHDDVEGRERTRRLFATVNRHAKPVSLGENVLLDEDDVSAIITRKLIEEYFYFKDREVIAKNKSGNIYRNQFSNIFTTVIALYNVNETLLDNETIYNTVYAEIGETFKNTKVRVRPDTEVIEEASEKIILFWNRFFAVFSDAVEFTQGKNNIGIERNSGGKYYLRPIGQEVIALVYKKLLEVGRIEDFGKLNRVPDNIKNDFWHFVMWNPHTEKVMQSKSYIRDYLMYQCGLEVSTKSINKMVVNYRKNSGNESAELPVSQQFLEG